MNQHSVPLSSTQSITSNNTNCTKEHCDDTRVLSSYQQKVLDFFKTSTSNMVVCATAGSGKTFMITKLTNLLHHKGLDEETLILSFSKKTIESMR